MADHPSNTKLPLDLVRQIDAICAKFETALRAGRTPDLARLLEQIPSVARTALLRQSREAVAARWDLRRWFTPKTVPDDPAIVPSWIEALTGSTWDPAQPASTPIDEQRRRAAQDRAFGSRAHAP